MAAPLTLPAKYTEGYTSGWKYVAIVKLFLSQLQPIYFCTQPDVTTQTTLKYLGNQLTTGSDLFFEDKLAARVASYGGDEREVEGIGEIDYAIDIQSGGGLATRNTFSLTFLNHGTFYDFLSQFDVENGDVEVWEGYLPLSGTFEITTYMILRYKGVIAGAPRYDYELVTLECVDSRDLDSVFLPKVKITEEDFPNRPKESDGKVVPILVGDFSSGVDPTLNLLDIAPTIMTDDVSPKFYLADHPVYSPGDIYYTSEEGVTGKFVPTESHRTLSGEFPQIIDDGTGKSKVEFGRGNPYADFILWPRIESDTPNLGFPVRIDHDNMVDFDLSTYADMPVTPSTGCQIVVELEQVKVPGKLIASMDLYGRDEARALPIDAVPGAYPTDYYIIMNYTDATGTVKIQRRSVSGASGAPFIDLGTIYGPSSGQAFINVNQSVLGSPITWDHLKDTQWRIYCDTSSSIKVKEFYIKIRSMVDSVKEVVRYQQDFLTAPTALGPVNIPIGWTAIPTGKKQVVSKVAAQTYGCMYGDWVSGRGYTPGQPIENPALFVEWLLREQMGVEDARIDSSSFDDAAAARSSWIIAASIHEQKRAEDHIRQICYEFGMILTLLPYSTNGKDRYTLTALPDSSASSVYTVTTVDTQFTDKPEIEIAWTGGGKIVNDFYVRYMVDYSTGQPSASVYCSDTNGDGVLSSNMSSDTGSPRGDSYLGWLTESQGRYRSRNGIEVTLDYVRDAATAEKFLKLYADWWAFKRQVVTMKVRKNLNTVDKQVGNVVKINVPLVGTDRKNISTYMITRVNFPPQGWTAPAYITWELEEIPSSITGLPIIKNLVSKTRITV